MRVFDDDGFTEVSTSFLIDTINPAVSAVRISSVVADSVVNGWSTAFRNYIDPVMGLGYVVPNTSTLPWTNLNRISVTFTEPVTKPNGAALTIGDIRVVGVNVSEYTVTSFSYNTLTNTATFTIKNPSNNAPVRNDKLMVYIDSTDVEIQQTIRWQAI